MVGLDGRSLLEVMGVSLLTAAAARPNGTYPSELVAALSSARMDDAGPALGSRPGATRCTPQSPAVFDMLSF